jgi:aerobic-type carbon monoxide dehydrogenase small subunit (CoxS/CutS family)
VRVSFTLDGARVELEAPEEQTIAEALSHHGHRSVRETCRIGVCGACTILLDGEPVSGCLLLTAQADGRCVTTVEGLSAHDPVIRAFSRAHAFQCGWCTPGMILSVTAMLAEDPDPPRAKAARELGGNLCRCGCYSRILDAVELAAEELRSDAHR